MYQKQYIHINVHGKCDPNVYKLNNIPWNVDFTNTPGM